MFTPDLMWLVFFYYTNIWAHSNHLQVFKMRSFHACSVVLAAVGYKQFLLFGEVPRPWKKKRQKKKKIQSVKKVNVSARWGALRVGRLSPRAPWSALTSISFFLFFPVFFSCLFFVYSRDGLRRKWGTARNVSQPRLVWTGHATFFRVLCDETK